MRENKYIRFFANCIPVKGHRKGAIYDLQRGELFEISNSIIEIIENNQNLTWNEILEKNQHQMDLLKKYIDFLLENELVFFTFFPNNFSNLELTIDLPFILDKLSIEINFESSGVPKINIEKIIMLIEQLGVLNLVLISFQSDLNHLINFTRLLRKSRIQYLTIVTKYSDSYKININKIFKEFYRLNQIIFYESPDLQNYDNQIYFYKEDLTSVMSENFDSPYDFILSIENYIKSKNINLYHYRSCFIDIDGNIKHAYYDNLNYGNINIENIFKIIDKSSFQELWMISKDNVEVCKDCQFRYICNDNRIPIKKYHIYEHTTKCKYNPYEDTWS